MNKIKTAAILMLLLSVLVGCSTAKHRMKAVESLGDIPSIASPITHLSAKAAMAMPDEDEEKPDKVNGTLRISQGEGTVLALTVAGMYEVARLEALPGEVALINKWDKQYTPILYDDLLMLEKSGINYSIFEALLSNTIFTHNGSRGLDAAADMKISDAGDDIHLTTKKIKRVQYRFVVEKASGNLVRTEILYNGVKITECLYSDFKYVDDRYIPHRIEIIAGVEELSDDKGSFLLELSKIKTKKINLKRTNLKNYDEVDIRTFYKTAAENF